MKRYSFILLFVLAFIGLRSQNALSHASPASAKEVINVCTLENTKESVRIGNKFAFFEDKSGTMSFEEVQKQKDYFIKDIEIPNFNITKNAIWGKIKFTCRQTANWYLQIDPASFNEVIFYKQNNHESWQKECFGNAYPTEQRSLAVNHYFFKLDLIPGDTTLVYFRVKDYYPIQFDIKAGTLEAFAITMHDSDLYNGICYGIMLMMLIYNFYLFITQKKAVYIYYVMYVFFSLSFSAYLSGYALHFPAALLKLIQFAPIIPPAGFGIFGLLFTLQLFNEALNKRLKTIIYIFMTVAFSDVILSAFSSEVHLSENIIQPLGLFLGILCISSAIVALKKKHTSAAYYLIGFGAYMFSLFYLILSAQGIFSATNFSWHALATGSAIESIMLSFALGDKVKVILREKEKAQQDALIQATENARLIKEQNVFLEQKVKERTLELEEQKLIVEEKQKDIIDSINYAKRIQQSQLPTEKYIDKNLKRLKKE